MIRPIQDVAWLFLKYLLLSNDGKQHSSPGLVVQTAAMFGMMRNHTNATATRTGLRKGTLGECSPHSIPTRDVTLQGPFSQQRLVRRSQRVHVTGAIPKRSLARCPPAAATKLTILLSVFRILQH